MCGTRSVVITGCDIAGITKPWNVQVKVTGRLVLRVLANTNLPPVNCSPPHVAHGRVARVISSFSTRHNERNFSFAAFRDCKIFLCCPKHSPLFLRGSNYATFWTKALNRQNVSATWKCLFRCTAKNTRFVEFQLSCTLLKNEATWNFHLESDQMGNVEGTRIFKDCFSADRWGFVVFLIKRLLVAWVKDYSRFHLLEVESYPYMGKKRKKIILAKIIEKRQKQRLWSTKKMCFFAALANRKQRKLACAKR